MLKKSWNYKSCFIKRGDLCIPPSNTTWMEKLSSIKTNKKFQNRSVKIPPELYIKIVKASISIHLRSEAVAFQETSILWSQSYFFLWHLLFCWRWLDDCCLSQAVDIWSFIWAYFRSNMFLIIPISLLFQVWRHQVDKQIVEAMFCSFSVQPNMKEIKQKHYLHKLTNNN